MFKLPHIPSLHRADKILLQNVYGIGVLFFLIVVMLVRSETGSSFGLLHHEEKKVPESVVFSFPSGFVLDTEAKAYVVYDVISKKVILGKNEELVLPLASMTKLATAATAYHVASTTKLITITPHSIDAGYDIGLKKGQIFKLDELIKYMLVFSSNDAANAIANSLGGQEVFVKAMNDLVQAEGMKTLYFTNPNGLDDGAAYGGEGSSLDVARLMAYVHKTIPELLDATSKTRAKVISSTGMLTGIPNTNQEVEHFTGIEGSKTGFTDEAGGNLTVVFDVIIGRPLVIVVMGSSREGRFTDVEKLYDFTKKALE